MSKTILQSTPEDRLAYHLRTAVERRRAAADGAVDEKWQRAQRVARQAAEVLKLQFAASRVVLFGSAARRDCFTPWSDIDLAVWDVPSDRFYAAVAVVTGLNAEIGVDVVDPERCSRAVHEAVEREGVEL